MNATPCHWAQTRSTPQKWPKIAARNRPRDVLGCGVGPKYPVEADGIRPASPGASGRRKKIFDLPTIGGCSAVGSLVDFFKRTWGPPGTRKKSSLGDREWIEAIAH